MRTVSKYSTDYSQGKHAEIKAKICFTNPVTVKV